MQLLLLLQCLNIPQSNQQIKANWLTFIMNLQTGKQNQFHWQTKADAYGVAGKGKFFHKLTLSQLQYLSMNNDGCKAVRPFHICFCTVPSSLLLIPSVVSTPYPSYHLPTLETTATNTRWVVCGGGGSREAGHGLLLVFVQHWVDDWDVHFQVAAGPNGDRTFTTIIQEDVKHQRNGQIS